MSIELGSKELVDREREQQQRMEREFYRSIQLAGQSSENLSVRFEVRDSGIGFTDEVAARLFQPFVQADNCVAKNFGGTGLGLAICAKLVRLMGGRIGAKGKPGEGATFWFEIPFPRHQERRKFAVHVA